ncbi:MAG: hypothetical protein OXS33_05575 [bacterium]|nr:hypothetical protein [bacterium]
MNSRLFPLGTVITLLLALAIVHAERSPSVSLEGRLQAQTSDDAMFYFPDYVAGGGWSVQLVLFNTDDTSAARITVAVYNQNGQRVSGLFARSSVSIPSLGSQVLRSRGTDSIRRGWITVEADAPSVSGLLTYRPNQTGIEVGVEPAEFGTRFVLFVEESNDIGTGLAIFKPDDSTGVELRIRDEDGNDPLDGEVVRVGNFNQRAKTIREWFEDGGADTSSVSDFRGLLFLQSEDGSRFAPLGLRFGKNTGSLSAVPAVKLAAADDCPAPNPFGGCGPTDPPQPPPTSRPAAPTVSAVEGEPEQLEIRFEDSFKARETKAYDVQVRMKSPRGDWAQECVTITNENNAARTGTATIKARGLNPDTVYEARFRHRNSSRCGGGTPGEWSEIGEGRTGRAGRPSVPTVTMSVSPTSIELGKNATLRWSSTNATSATITPEIGSVPTSGSRSVSPSSTTTYRITVRSSDGQTASDTARVTVTDPPPDDTDDYQTLKGFTIANDGTVTLKFGNFTNIAGPGRCISFSNTTINGQTYSLHQTAWQRDTGSGWQDVSGTKKTGQICGYDLASAPSGKYRAVGDMTVAGTRGKYKSENEVSK